MENAVVREIKKHRSELRLLDVKSLSVFGSIARNTATSESDVDVLVSFTGPATFDRYMDLKFYLEDLLGRSVDLVTEEGLRPELRPYIEQDMVCVA